MMRESCARLQYEGLDERIRATELCFAPPPKVLEEQRALWELRLPPHASNQLTTTIAMSVCAKTENLRATDQQRETLEVARRHSAERYTEWVENCTRMRSDNQIFDAMIETSAADFYALRMPEERGTAVAAGVPWFAALFGRDSLLSSYESLLLDPDLARGHRMDAPSTIAWPKSSQMPMSISRCFTPTFQLQVQVCGSIHCS